MRHSTIGKSRQFLRTAAAFLLGTGVVGAAGLAGMTPAAAATKQPPAQAAVAGNTATRVIRVGSARALAAAVDFARSGDRIELATGSYYLSDTLEIDASGTAAAPIVIAAAAGAEPQIRGYGSLAIEGDYVTVAGLTFLSSDTVKVTSAARHAHITGNTFHNGYAAVNWLTVAGDDAEIDHNQFSGKRSVGVFLQIIGPGSSGMAKNVRVHDNYFADHRFSGSNGGEALRLGLSNRQHADAGALVEDNLFERVNGDEEAISVKSSGNTIRHNTIRDSRGTITLRHGSDNIIDSNLLIGGQTGIRVFGNDQTVINNIVQDSTRPRIIEVGGGNVRDDYASRNNHDAADRVLVAFNTVVTASKASTAFAVGDEDDRVAPDSVTIANNILVSGKRAVQAERGSRLTWVGNLGAGSVDRVSTGFRAANAKLVKDGGGVYRPAAGSAALGAALGTWKQVTLDVDGQVRPALGRSVGADEPSLDATTNLEPATKLSLGLA